MWNDKSSEQMDELIEAVKKYVRLQKEYVRLELVEKLTVILSGLVLVLAMVCLGMIALFYFSFTLAYVMADWVGSLTASFAIITLFLLLILLGIYRYRESLIVKPFVRFLTHHLMEEPKEEE